MNYLNEIAGLTPRLLSLLDRDSFSPSYGCFDRDYWHYKIIRDYPASIYQQGVLSLALLYKNNFSGNIYYKNDNILKWIEAGLLFWSKIQNRDGSFNEWYPYEHSHVATAFTSYAVSEAILLLGDELSQDNKEALTKSLILSGKWLKNNKDKLVINHTAGAVAALYNIYILTGDSFFIKALEEDIEIIARNQDEEGWFSEYGGADIGYQSVSIDYLAKYFKKSNDSKVRDLLEKALNFLVYFIHPDGSSGGVYGSRNTCYLMPYGIVILAPYFPSARYILKSIWTRLGRQINIFDDRYFVFFMLPNIIQAGLEFREELMEYKGVDYRNYHRIFKNAGLISIKNEKYHFICNLRKGGVLNVFSNDRLILSDSGYFGIGSKGRIFTSQWLDNKMVINNDMAVEKQFVMVNSKTLTLKNLLLLRLFNLTIGRVGRFAGLLNKYIKQKKILNNKKVPIFLKRRINLKENEILIEDEIDTSRGKCRFNKFGLGIDEAVMHVPSSRYFQEGILNSYILKADIKEELNQRRKASILRRIVFSGDSYEYIGINSPKQI